VTVLTLQSLTKIFPRAGTVVDSIDLRIEEGEFLTLLGPSGCGKSTILRMIAGFEEPTGGRIYFNDRDVTSDPPNRRGIGFVFQNYALFPHLSVAKNVAFGLEVRKLPSAKIDEQVTAALQQVQLAGLGSERVDRLSGGQQQRVALARALVIRPELLLLDEPLSNLDAKLREGTRATLRALHSATGVTTVYVTHDQAEAMGMSDRIAILNRGKIEQLMPPVDIYERPATRFVADFIGRNNVLDAVVASMSAQTAVVRFSNGTELTVDPRRRAAGVELTPGARIGVCLRAESLRLAGENGAIRGVLTDVEYAGSGCSCAVQTELGQLRVDVPSSVGRPIKGEPINLDVNEAAVHIVGPQ
jgi:iron(III) transport system ATP-binding protein